MKYVLKYSKVHTSLHWDCTADGHGNIDKMSLDKLGDNEMNLYVQHVRREILNHGVTQEMFYSSFLSVFNQELILKLRNPSNLISRFTVMAWYIHLENDSFCFGQLIRDRKC